jgi:transcriptional regulator with XRE-family HTH domain
MSEDWTRVQNVLWEYYKRAEAEAPKGEFYSQTQFAKDNGISQAAMSSYMTGRRVPNIDSALELEEHFPGVLEALIEDGALPMRLAEYIRYKKLPDNPQLKLILDQLPLCSKDEIAEILEIVQGRGENNHHVGETERKDTAELNAASP